MNMNPIMIGIIVINMDISKGIYVSLRRDDEEMGGGRTSNFFVDVFKP